MSRILIDGGGHQGGDRVLAVVTSGSKGGLLVGARDRPHLTMSPFPGALRRIAGATIAMVFAVSSPVLVLGADEPAASAVPDTGLPARLVTEEIEPGVYRVLSDGHRELSLPIEGYEFDGVGKGWGWLARSHEYRSIVAAPDGSIWFFEPERFFRVGRQREWRWRSQPELRQDDFGVAPDGTVWRATGRTADPVRSFDGSTWKRHSTQKVDPSRRIESIRGIEIGPDGTVWTTWWQAFGADSIVFDKFARWNGKRWKLQEPPKLRPSYGSQFTVAGKDEIWVCCKDKPSAERQRLLRYDGRGWKTIRDPAPGKANVRLLIDGVDDGTLWIRRNSTTLARRDDEGWTVFTTTDEDGPTSGWTRHGGEFLRGSLDDSVWVPLSNGLESGECDGLGRFDGETWSRYLAGTCIFAMDIAADGTAWVQAARMDPDDGQGLPLEPIQTYAIVPGSTVGPDEDEPIPTPS